LLPASVAAAGCRPTRAGKMSSYRDNWTSVAFEILTETKSASKSFTNARIVSGGATVALTITGLEARQASFSTNMRPSSAISSKNMITMLYAMDLKGAAPLVVEPVGKIEHPFAASAHSQAGISLGLNAQPLGIGFLLHILQSNGASSFSRWNLNTSLQSRATHGALKVAASERFFAIRPQILVGDSAFSAERIPIDYDTAECHSSITFIPTLEPMLQQKSHWRPRAATSHRGATLVTGALGGLGSLVSTWAALENHSRGLLLAGRTVQSDKLAFIGKISAVSQNSTITISQVNVACCEDMAALLSDQAIEFIHHTSGTLVDGSINNQSLSGERTVFAPKVAALERLESNVSSVALQNVALFSSITSLLGTRGQANYAAANAVLDASASMWEEQGRSRCASIQWGAWSGSGMAASHPSLLKRLQVQGYGSVSPVAGLQAMQSILYTLTSPVVVANPFDWSVFLKQFKEYRQILFAEREKAAGSAAGGNAVLLATDDKSKANSIKVRSISKESIAATILGLVRGIISEENASISLDTPFFEAGLDSIGMVELNNAIVSSLKIETLSSTALFDYPNINDLAQHLTTLLVAASDPAGWSVEAERNLPTSSGCAFISAEEIEVTLLNTMKDSFGLDIVNTSTPFSEAGLDSITSVEFQKSVQETFHLDDFPVTAVFDFPTVAILAVEISRRLERQRGALASSHQPYLNLHELSRPPAAAFNKQVVVTGMASSFPTANNEHSALMKTILQGKDTSAMIPISKWDIDSIYSAEAGTENTSYCRFASLLPTATQVSFDSEIFRVTRNEAIVMDPHARLLLEHVKEAHQDSFAHARNYKREGTAAVGVFVGCMWSNEYMEMLPQLGVSQVTAPAITGNTFPFLAGRVAYSFGWRGPCVPTDTACSSSLVAAHVGRLSMMANECQAAAVGGVNALLSATTTVKICALQALSPVGRCKSFDASADGYGRGEAFAVVMLELARDRQIENSVIAYLASTSVNTAGRSSGLTAPSGPAQRELVIDAITAAELTPAAVNMVAVHGTGTSLGDPIEIGALCQALNLKQPGREPHADAMVIASAKSCFAHTEGAAGLTGALLAIGALNAQVCPSILNLRNMNPYVASSLDQAAAAMLPMQQAAASAFKSSGLAGK
jgi:3-oxoacyl-(acyl-carrier-protein) synthase/acyl carrier protein